MIFLAQHSLWFTELEKASQLPPFKQDYLPNVIEVIDQFGVLFGVAFGVPYEEERPRNLESEFIAWYLDGELALFYTKDQILVDRLFQMALNPQIFIKAR